MTTRRWSLSSVYRLLLLTAGGLGFAGERLSLPFLTNLALLSAALLMVMVGGELIITKRAEFALGGWAYIQGKETFKGVAAQLWGVLFLGMGLLAGLATLAKWFFPAETDFLWSRLQGTPAGAGLAITGLGVAAGLYGTIRLLAGGAGVDLGRMTKLSNVMDRIGGAVIFLLGIGLAALGLLLIIAPSLVFGLAKQLAAYLL
jgi:hypothetical protein